MKKLLFTFSLVLAMSSFALAQGIVNISGYVTDANGNAMGGYPVEVMSDSLTGINFYTMAYTNNSGYYSVNATVGMISQGGFYVWTQDSCSFNFLSQTVYFNPGSMSISNVDFTICQNGSGGGSCASAFTYQTNPNGVVTFSGTASGGQAPYTYSWTLGNGMATSGQTTTATYTNGLYLVCLTVTDAVGCSSSYCDTVNVNTGGGGTGCSASFTHQTTMMGSIGFSSSTSGTTGAISYLWDFGDGSTSTTANPNHTYSSNGMYLACLTILDASNCVSTYCDTVSVNNGSGSNCAAYFSYQATPSGAITFGGIATGGQGPYTYSWSFGNGTSATGQVVTAIYNAPGVYFPCLTITDATGCTDTYCDSLVIGGTPSCSATISYSTNNTLTANFSATTTGTAPFTYSWDFGDSLGTSTSANPTYTYGANGIYYACVTVTDANGCSATACDLVVVNVATSGSLNVLVVSDSLSGFPQAVVYLIEHDTVAGTLTAIQTDTTMQGFATFNNMPFGNYLIKAALLSSDPNYSSYLPTYYTQSLNWSGGTNIQLTPSMVGFTYIELIAGTNVGTGPGFIGGLISQGANRGPGDPLEGVLVILYDANMNPIGYTYSDVNGEYSFDNLPYGVYYIYVEELGLMAAPIEVTLSPTTPTMDEVNFDVETSSVRFTNTNEILSVSELKIYPNPVTDELYMQFELDQTLDAEISIVNVTGQVLSNIQRTLNGGSNLIQVQTSELPAGVYTIFLKSEAGIITQKFVKQ